MQKIAHRLLSNFHLLWQSWDKWNWRQIEINLVLCSTQRTNPGLAIVSCDKSPVINPPIHPDLSTLLSLTGLIICETYLFLSKLWLFPSIVVPKLNQNHCFTMLASPALAHFFSWCQIPFCQPQTGGWKLLCCHGDACHCKMLRPVYTIFDSCFRSVVLLHRLPTSCSCRQRQRFDI